MSSYWHLAGRTNMTCLLGSRREAFCKVHECPVEVIKVSKDATPAADSENQVLSQKPGLCVHCCSAPWTAAGPGHLPSHFSQPPCGPVSCQASLHFRFPYPQCVTHLILCFSFSFQSTYGTQISFLLPPSSLATARLAVRVVLGCTKLQTMCD